MHKKTQSREEPSTYLTIGVLIALTFWLRIWSSLDDGLCDRGRVQTMPNTSGSWISWHVVNWMRRDIVIVVIYALIGFRYILPAIGTSAFWMRLGLAGLALAVLALIDNFPQDKLHCWAFYHREKFLRGSSEI